MSESKILAEEGIPSVFSLVSILENPQDIHTLIGGPPSHLRLDIYLFTPLLGVYSQTLGWIFNHIFIRGPPSHLRLDIYSHPY